MKKPCLLQVVVFQNKKSENINVVQNRYIIAKVKKNDNETN